MPSSKGYAIGSVRVLERTLLTSEKLERLAAAPSARDALKMLGEYGYGKGQEAADEHAYEAWLSETVADAVAYLRRCCPDERVTNAFLADIDCHNIKVLVKARKLERDNDDMLLPGGQLDVGALKEAIAAAEYNRLPAAFAEPLKKLDKELALAFDPQKVNVRLDAAMIEMALSLTRAARFDSGVRYFQMYADRANVLALLRIKTMRRGKEAFSAAYLPGGLYARDLLLGAWDAPTSLHALPPYASFLRDGLQAWEATGGATTLERSFDDALLSIFSRKRYHNDGLEPIVGYYLARQRECANIRLILVAKINGLPPSSMTERLRELYG